MHAETLARLLALDRRREPRPRHWIRRHVQIGCAAGCDDPQHIIPTLISRALTFSHRISIKGEENAK